MQTLLKIRNEAEKDCVLEFNQSQWLKPYVEFNTQKRIQVEKNSDKNGKTLYKSMSNAVNGKTMGNLRNRIDVKLVTNLHILECVFWN